MLPNLGSKKSGKKHNSKKKKSSGTWAVFYRGVCMRAGTPPAESKLDSLLVYKTRQNMAYTKWGNVAQQPRNCDSVSSQLETHWYLVLPLAVCDNHLSTSQLLRRLLLNPCASGLASAPGLAISLGDLCHWAWTTIPSMTFMVSMVLRQVS